MAKVESIVRLMDALVNDEETIAFARLADEAYGTGGYLINDSGSLLLLRESISRSYENSC